MEFFAVLPETSLLRKDACVKAAQGGATGIAGASTFTRRVANGSGSGFAPPRLWGPGSVANAKHAFKDLMVDLVQCNNPYNTDLFCKDN